MILLPIGHEEDGVRRLPWVSFGVMILCALAFFATGRQAIFAEDDTELSEDVLRSRLGHLTDVVRAAVVLRGSHP